MYYPKEVYTLRYKGYRGDYRLDAEGVFRGRLIGIRDVVTFQGRTEPQAEASFCDSVDDYLAFCRKLDRPPDTPDEG